MLLVSFELLLYGPKPANPEACERPPLWPGALLWRRCRSQVSRAQEDQQGQTLEAPQAQAVWHQECAAEGGRLCAKSREARFCATTCAPRTFPCPAWSRDRPVRVAIPLRAKATKRGAPAQPETRQEVATAIAKHVEANSCIAASDSGHGLVQAFQEAEMPHATARHYIDATPPLQKLPQSSFSKQQLKLARKLATAKRPAAAFEKIMW